MVRKVTVKQYDGSYLSGGNFMINHWFQVFFSFDISLVELSLHSDALDIRKKDVVLGLSWLKENRCVVDLMDRCLRNVSTGLLIPCSVLWIPTVSLMNLEEEPLENKEVLQILDTRNHYFRYTQEFSIQQADRLPKHKS